VPKKDGKVYLDLRLWATVSADSKLEDCRLEVRYFLKGLSSRGEGCLVCASIFLSAIFLKYLIFSLMSYWVVCMSLVLV
jgi:hypothetical protein